MFLDLGYWLPIKDGDPRASAIYARHYSAHQYADKRRQLHGYRNRHLIMGPGEKQLLLGNDERALFAWRKFIDRSGQTGVNCAIFRNEGEQRSSDLIREACAIAWARWPQARLYTYVSLGVASRRPGWCFERAGWRQCGRSQSGLLVFEIRPPRVFVEMPDA